QLRWRGHYFALVPLALRMAVVANIATDVKVLSNPKSLAPPIRPNKSARAPGLLSKLIVPKVISNPEPVILIVPPNGDAKATGPLPSPLAIRLECAIKSRRASEKGTRKRF